MTDLVVGSPTKPTPTLVAVARSTDVSNQCHEVSNHISDQIYASTDNICNSTTEGQSSKCQTAFINSIDDWCVWGPPEPNSEVGSTEGEAVAWCTKPGRGTRIIPAGAITGVQFLRSPSYLEVIAFLDQTMLNLEPSDYGGELDPHGGDLVSDAWAERALDCG